METVEMLPQDVSDLLSSSMLDPVLEKAARFAKLMLNNPDLLEKLKIQLDPYEIVLALLCSELSQRFLLRNKLGASTVV